METDDTTPVPPVIRSQADLEQVWRRLMEPLGFTRASVWLMLVTADGEPVRQLVEIDEAEEPPDRDQRAQLARLLHHVLDHDSGHRVAFLRTRPGRGGLSAADRRWADALYATAREAGVPCEVVHVANDVRLVPVPLDELAARRSA